MGPYLQKSTDQKTRKETPMNIEFLKEKAERARERSLCKDEDIETGHYHTDSRGSFAIFTKRSTTSYNVPMVADPERAREINDKGKKIYRLLNPIAILQETIGEITTGDVAHMVWMTSPNLLAVSVQLLRPATIQWLRGIVTPCSYYQPFIVEVNKDPEWKRFSPFPDFNWSELKGKPETEEVSH